MSDTRIKNKLTEQRLENFLKATSAKEISTALDDYLSHCPISHEEKENYKFVGPAGEDYMPERWEVRHHLLSAYMPLPGLHATTQVSRPIETDLVKKTLEDTKYTPSTTTETQDFINQLKKRLYPAPALTHEKILQFHNVMNDITMTAIPASLKEWIKIQLFEPNNERFLMTLNDPNKIEAEFIAYKKYLSTHNLETAEELTALKKNQHALPLFAAQCRNIYTAAINLCVAPELKEDHSELPTKHKDIALGKPEFTILAAVCIQLEERIASGQLAKNVPPKKCEEMLLNLRRMVEKFEKRAGVNTTYMRKQPETSSTATPVILISTSTITPGRRS